MPTGTRTIVPSTHNPIDSTVTFTTYTLGTFVISSQEAPTDAPPDAPPAVESLAMPLQFADSPPRETLRLTIGQPVFTYRGMPSLGDAAPFIADERAMVPLRNIAEALGATVGWHDETRTVTITRDTTVLTLAIDQPLPDGMGTAVIVYDRTFVPARYVSEMLGATVRWDDVNSAVYIY